MSKKPLNKRKTSPLHTGIFFSVLLTGLFANGFADAPFLSANTKETNSPSKETNSSSTKANDSKNNESKSIFRKTQPTLEGKLGYFFFTNSKMSKIYSEGGLDAQISASYPLWRGLEIYGSLEYLERSGKSLNGHQKTSLYQIPFNLGLRPVITITKEVQYYVAMGPRYFYVHQHNHSSYVPKDRGRSGVGFFVNTGFNFLPWHGLLIDIFGEYSWEKTRFHDAANNVYGQKIQIGGFTFGGGLGYAF